MNLLLGLCIIGVIVSRAIADSYRDNGKKLIGKRWREVMVLFWLLAIVVSPGQDFCIFFCSGLFYMFMKFSLFNPLYNFFTENEWYHVGSTSDTDIIEGKVDILVAFAGRIVSFAMAILIYWMGIVRY